MKTAKKKKDPLPDHTNHEKTKDALRDSDRKYRELVELLPQTVFEIDRNGKITFVNPVALHIFGYSEEEFKAGVNIFDIFVHEDHARLMANIHKILSGEKLSGIEYTARKKDGSTVPVLTYSVPVILENIPVGLRGVLIDISDRKVAEEALRESKDLYQALAESSPEMIYLIDHKGCIRYVNSLAARQFKRSPAELIGKNLDQIFPPDIARHHMEGITRTIETGQTRVSEILESFPGRDFWMCARLSPIKDAAGEVTQVLGLSSDITEQKRAEEALRESEEKFRRLAETTQDIIVTTDFDGIITYANPAARNLVGGQEVIGASIQEFMPEDLIEKHQEMLNARRQGFSGTLSFEWKLRLPGDGSIVLLDVVSAVIIDKNRPSGILFNARDITERRKSEEARLQTLSLLEATLESTADGILVVNASGKIVNYNRKFAQMWHIPEAVLAMHDDTLALNHIREQLQDPEGFLQKVQELYATPLAVSFDTIVFRDGRIFERYSQPQRIGDKVIGRVWSFRDVTERNRAEVVQRETAAALTSIFRAAPIGIGVVSDRIIQRVNARLCEMTGYSREELIGKSARILYPDDEEFEKVGTEKYAKIRKHGTGSLETLWQFRDGSIHNILLSSTPLDPKDIAAGVTFTAMDITERKDAEERLRFLAHVSDAAPASITVHDFDGRFLYANEETFRLHGYTREEFLAKNLHEIDVPQSEQLIAARMQKIQESGEGNFDVQHFRKDGSTFPLHVNVKTIDWGGRKSLLSIATDITVRKRAEEAILKSETRYRELIELLPQTIFEIDRQGKIMSVNPAGLKLFDYSKEDLEKGVSAFEIFAPNDHQRLAENIQGIMRGERSGGFEYTAQRKDGSTFPVITYSVPIIQEHAPVGLRGVLIDISERKAAEEAIQESEERFRTLADAAMEGIMIHDRGIILDCNPQFSKLFGYKPEEIIGKNGFEFLMTAESLDAISRWKQNGAQGMIDITGIKKDGTRFSGVTASNAILWHGKQHSIVQMNDITERKRAEEALRVSKENYRGVIENLQDVFYRTDAAGNIIMASPSVAEVFGYSSVDEVIGLNLSRDFYKDPAKRLEFMNEIKKTGTVRNFEADLKKKDGTLITVSTSAHYYRDPDGKILGIEGIAKDITEWKHAEEALRVSEEKYRIVSEMAKDGIAIVQNNKLVYVNPSLAHIGGYSVEELTGASFLRFVAPESVGDLLSIIKNALLGKPVPEFFTTRIRHRNGHTIEIEANGTTIIWEGKKALLGIIRDVTERNRIEKELRKYSEKLEEMVSERTEKLNKSLGEKEVLLREVHHRVKNNLQIIISLLNLQSRYITDEKTLAAIRESQNRVKAMALVHEKLHQSTDISKINLNDYIKFLGNSLFRFYGMMGKGVKLTTDIHDLYLDINTTIPLGLITNELVSNSLKYAFPPGKKGEISIAITRENDVLTVVFKDNGAGMPMDFDWRNAKSLGLRLVISLVEQLQGTIELDRTSGTMFTMVLHEKQQ